MNDYPLHDEMQAREPERFVVQSFLDWLDDQGWELCSYSERYGHPVPICRTKAHVIARYFEIDLEQFEDEKRAMLAALSKLSQQQGSDATDTPQDTQP